jgi:murein DD-endopeptidase MepM/ murein hydrolase activator NlpD
LPEPNRRLPRLTEARPLSRAIAHLAVAGLVAFSAAFGLAALHGGAPAQNGLSFDVVATARGAATQAGALQSAHYVLEPQTADTDPLLSRRVFPTPTPTPTPVPTATPKPRAAPQSVAVVSNGTLLWPVPGAVITQYFWSGHLAVDLAVSAGSPVLAAASGTVVWAGWRTNGGGLVVEIDHGNGLHTVYNHLGAILVAAGTSVTRGQRIASVGCTGNCTGPHVHFQVSINGVFVNPLRYISR